MPLPTRDTCWLLIVCVRDAPNKEAQEVSASDVTLPQYISVEPPCLRRTCRPKGISYRSPESQTHVNEKGFRMSQSFGRTEYAKAGGTFYQRERKVRLVCHVLWNSGGRNSRQTCVPQPLTRGPFCKTWRCTPAAVADGSAKLDHISGAWASNLFSMVLAPQPPDVSHHLAPPLLLATLAPGKEPVLFA